MKADENPFRASAVARLRYRMRPEVADGVIARLRAASWRACLRGPAGTGKTTLLEDLEPHLQAAGLETRWVRLTLESDGPARAAAVAEAAALSAGQCLLFDGGEVLGWLGWHALIRQVRRSGGGLVATTHRRCALPAVFTTRTDESLALELARGLAGAHWSPDLEATARAAFRASRGDVREVFRACYWHCAEKHLCGEGA
ncbi:MAG: hypothetical protein JJU00_05540 [Opitutales bacterium]|nr:hypothetical protein [Opitutales bacterium]